MPRSPEWPLLTRCLSVKVAVENHLLDLDMDGNIN